MSSMSVPLPMIERGILFRSQTSGTIPFPLDAYEWLDWNILSEIDAK